MAENNDNKQPLISFIITDYNVPATLIRQCIESIMALNLNQNMREIILVDDGSDISPMEELADLQHQITYIHQQNQGLSAARNTGIEKSKATYIQFIDADDCLIKSGYDIIIDKINSGDTYSEPVNILMFRQTDSPAPAKTIANILKLSWYTSNSKFLEGKNLRASACGYVFRREILGNLRFTSGIFHEDEEFTPLLFLKSANIFFTSIKAYYYRKREGSITHNNNAEHKEKCMTDFRNIILQLRHYAIANNVRILDRRINQLKMDYVYKALTSSNNYSTLCKHINRLKEYKLFPIPIKPYTLKYFAFSIASRYKIGRKMLFKILSR